MEKLLIGNKEYVGKQNTDNYIDIDLLRTIETIKRDSIENVFDFQQQYVLERNDSMKFCVYGMVESRFGHSDNLVVNITVGNTESSGATMDLLYLPNKWSGGTTGYSTTVLTYPLNGNSNNSKFATLGLNAVFSDVIFPFLSELFNEFISFNSLVSLVSSVNICGSSFLELFIESSLGIGT